MSNVVGRTHRSYAREFKLQVIREALEPGVSVSVVARRHDINANVVFGWLKQYRDGKLAVPARQAVPRVSGAELLSVDVIDSALGVREPQSGTSLKDANRVSIPEPACEIEVEIGKRRVKIRGLSAEYAEAFLQDCLK